MNDELLVKTDAAGAARYPVGAVIDTKSGPRLVTRHLEPAGSMWVWIYGEPTNKESTQ